MINEGRTSSPLCEATAPAGALESGAARPPAPLRHVVHSSPVSEVFKSGGLQARLLVYRKTTSFRKRLAERESESERVRERKAVAKREKSWRKSTSCEEQENRGERDRGRTGRQRAWEAEQLRRNCRETEREERSPENSAVDTGRKTDRTEQDQGEKD